MTGYDSAYAALLERAETQPTLGHDEASHQMVLTNLYHLCPNLTWPQMLETAHAAAFSQAQAIMDLRHGAELLGRLNINDHAGIVADPGPYVFTAPHFSSYRMIAAYLLSLGRPLTIVIDDLVADAQAKEFNAMFADYAKQANLPVNALTFRYTSQVTILIGMARDLKQGSSLLLYFDGNKSTADNADHTGQVDFMGYSLAARIGIPLVAQMTRVPIVYVKARRGSKPDSNTLTFNRPFLVAKDEKDAPRAAMQKLWSALAADVGAQPDQWEALRYVHKFMRYSEPAHCPPAPTTQPLSFNHRRFAIKRIGDRGEVLDRGRISVTGVKGNLLQALSVAAAAAPNENVRLMLDPPEIINWMYERCYLTA